MCITSLYILTIKVFLLRENSLDQRSHSRTFLHENPQEQARVPISPPCRKLRQFAWTSCRVSRLPRSFNQLSLSLMAINERLWHTMIHMPRYQTLSLEFSFSLFHPGLGESGPTIIAPFIFFGVKKLLFLLSLIPGT